MGEIVNHIMSEKESTELALIVSRKFRLECIKYTILEGSILSKCQIINFSIAGSSMGEIVNHIMSEKESTDVTLIVSRQFRLECISLKLMSQEIAFSSCIYFTEERKGKFSHTPFCINEIKYTLLQCASLQHTGINFFYVSKTGHQHFLIELNRACTFLYPSVYQTLTPYPFKYWKIPKYRLGP